MKWRWSLLDTWSVGYALGIWASVALFHQPLSRISLFLAGMLFGAQVLRFVQFGIAAIRQSVQP